MADPTFFDLFETQWAETGIVDVMTLPQYRAGWAFIGSLPPTVEQFNKIQQLNDQKLAWLFHQVKAVATETGQEIGPATLDILIHALQNLDMGKATKGTLPVVRGGTGLTSVPDGHLIVGDQDGNLRTATLFSMLPARHFPLIHSITALPVEDVGPIVVAEVSEVWIWQETAHFVGYRSPLCGRPVDGHTVTPLASEIDAVGGLLPKAAYGRLWGYALENGLVVSQETWTANLGAHYFVDVNGAQFRVPDLRNMFRRYTGTDTDTGSSRWSGSRQLDALQRITGGFHAISDFNSEFPVVWSQDGAFLDGGTGVNAPSIDDIISQEKPTRRTGFDSARVTRSSSETRPSNVAFHPRIHA
ncbi:hypothetical protein [Achromobacter sp.]|uniref:hypothetical protein n=1 Tax=Achromobacter sp. TaxID=134375 RepID=UPI003C71CA0F